MTRIGQQSPFLHGIPIVLNSAQRDQLFPTPDTNQRVQNLTTGYVERYDGAQWQSDIATGRGAQVFDAKAYGAKGDATADDTNAIMAAYNACLASGGGVVFLPTGTYRVTNQRGDGKGLVFEPNVSGQMNVIFRGAGMDVTLVIADDATLTECVRFGSATRDNSGTSAHTAFGGGARDITFAANSKTLGITVVKVAEGQSMSFYNVKATGASASGGMGWHLVGSLTTGGVSANAQPHVWNCTFIQCIGDNCRRPWLLENADENAFIECKGLVTQGLSVGSRALKSWEIMQGRDNYWVRTLAEGDPNTKTSYVGIQFDTAVQGDVTLNVFDGVITEGHDCGVLVQGANARGNAVLNHYSSINNTNFSNVAGSLFKYSENLLPLDFRDAPTPVSTVTSITLALGANGAPAVNAGNTYIITGNGGGSTLKSFASGYEGQLIWVRIDQNTTLIDVNNSGTDLYLWGHQNITAPNGAVLWVQLLRAGGVWEQIGPPTFRTAGNAGSYVLPVALVERTLALTDGATVSVDASLANYLTLAAGGSRTIAAPTNPLNGQTISFELLNNTGGAITTTWNAAYKLAGAWVDPATTKRRTIAFSYNGSNWIEQCRAAADI